MDVQLTLDQCRAVRIKPAEGRVEALSDTEGITANLGGIKGYNTIVDGLYDGTYMRFMPACAASVLIEIATTVWNGTLCEK